MTATSMTEQERRAVIDLLEETPVLTLATLEPDGVPRATPLYFAHQSLDLVFLSDPESQHSRNLERQPQCAVGLYPSAPGWQELRGLQMRGTAHRLSGDEAAAARHAYASRFPFVEAVPEAMERAAPYRFTPTWLRRIDNRQGFGFQQEWALDG